MPKEDGGAGGGGIAVVGFFDFSEDFFVRFKHYGGVVSYLPVHINVWENKLIPRS
jgi:hypothetical protein